LVGGATRNLTGKPPDFPDVPIALPRVILRGRSAGGVSGATVRAASRADDVPSARVPYRGVMHASDLRPYLWMLSGCFWFSWMGLLAHGLKHSCDWQTMATARSVLAATFAALLAWSTGVRLVFAGPRALWFRSLAGSCSLVGTFYAITHLPVSDALTLTNTFPVWVALVSWPLAGEKPTLAVWGAVGCAVAGVAVTQGGSFSGFGLAHVAALCAAFFTAVAMLGLNRLKGIPSLAVVVHFSAVAAVAGGLAFFAFDRPIGNENATDPAVLLRLLGVGATAFVGQVFLTKAYRGGSPTKVSVVGLSQVVMVMAFEGLIDGRAFTAWQLVGTALVLGPTAYLMARERRVTKVTQPEAVME